MITTKQSHQGCYACGHTLKTTYFVHLIDDDGAIVEVGVCCYKKIKAAKENGYQPIVGPRLFLTKEYRLEFLARYSHEIP